MLHKIEADVRRPSRQIAERLAALELRRPEAQSLTFVCHQPPAKTRCDRTSLGQHVGSRAVRRFLEQVQPRVCLTGHIHEGIGVDLVSQTTVVNPGLLWMGGYAIIELIGTKLRVECSSIVRQSSS